MKPETRELALILGACHDSDCIAEWRNRFHVELSLEKESVRAQVHDGGGAYNVDVIVNSDRLKALEEELRDKEGMEVVVGASTGREWGGPLLVNIYPKWYIDKIHASRKV